MKDRFDLEDEISKLYSFVDNINEVSNYISETDTSPEVIDNATSILSGISALLTIHTDKLMDTMCQCLKLDGYAGLNINISNLRDIPLYKTSSESIDSCCSGNVTTDPYAPNGPIYHGDMPYSA